MNKLLNKFIEFKRDFLIIFALEFTIIATTTIFIIGE